MAGGLGSDISALVSRNEQTILPEWMDLQKKAGTLHTGRISEGELQSQSRNFLQLLRDGLAKGGSDATDAAYEPAKAMLADLSRSRALQGFDALHRSMRCCISQRACAQERRCASSGGP